MGRINLNRLASNFDYKGKPGVLSAENTDPAASGARTLEVGGKRRVLRVIELLARSNFDIKLV